MVLYDTFNSPWFLFGSTSKIEINTVTSCVTVSEEHRIYVLDSGLTKADTEHLIAVTEQAGRGQYAAYTYAKQTLGCRDHPTVAVAVQSAVHSVVAGVLELQEQINQKQLQQLQQQLKAGSHKQVFKPPQLLALDDREPHMVKYDITRKERQRIDMHTDKSEWTFLVALSNGGGLDYCGGGTYFECLDATVHVQRGHALVFPGTLRHCGQRITSGLRFLLVGFLVDKHPTKNTATSTTTTTTTTTKSNNNNNNNNGTGTVTVVAEPKTTTPAAEESDEEEDYYNENEVTM